EVGGVRKVVIRDGRLEITAVIMEDDIEGERGMETGIPEDNDNSKFNPTPLEIGDKDEKTISIVDASS
ncbi:hypothetical protein KI387_039624, partial [Taxus chinensis]